MELKQLTKEKKSVMRNLTKEELKEVQGGDSGMSISVKASIPVGSTNIIGLLFVYAYGVMVFSARGSTFRNILVFGS